MSVSREGSTPLAESNTNASRAQISKTTMKGDNCDDDVYQRDTVDCGRPEYTNLPPKSRASV